jgi:hypothetical protein
MSCKCSISSLKQTKAACPLSALNKPENEYNPYVRFPPSCRRSEGGDGGLKGAAAAITAAEIYM